MEHSDYQDRLETYKEEHLPVVLTPAEAMDILGVGKNTLYRMLHSGQLPAVRIGRIWRIPLYALDTLFFNFRMLVTLAYALFPSGLQRVMQQMGTLFNIQFLSETI